MRPLISKTHCCLVILILIGSAPLPAQDEKQEEPVSKKTTTTDEPAEAKKEGESEKSTPATPGKLTEAAVKAALNDVEAAEIGDELKKNITEIYQQALVHLKAAGESENALENFKKVIDSTPGELEKIKKELAAHAGEAEPKLDLPADATLKSLTDRVRQENSDVETLRGDLKKKEDEVENLQGRPEKARTEQAAAKKKLDEVEEKLKAPVPSDQNALLTKAGQTLLEARKMARTAELATLKQEILSHSVHLELRTAERDQLAGRVARREAQLKLLEEAVNRLREAEADSAKAKAEAERRAAMGKHPLIKSVAEENAKLSTELAKIAEDTNKVTPEKQFAKTRSEQLNDVLQRITGLLKQSGLSGVGGAFMREQAKKLPDVLRLNEQVRQQWSGRITEAESRRFQISLDRRDLSVTETAVTRLIDAYAEPISESERPEIQRELRELLTNRKELLSQLRDSYNSFLAGLRELETAQTELSDTALKLQDLLNQRLLWIPSAAIPGSEDLTNLGQALRWLFDHRDWRLAVVALKNDVTSRWGLWLFVGLLTGGLVAFRKRTRQRLDSLSRNVGRPRQDQFVSTIEALFWSAILVLPLGAVLAFLGWRLTVGEVHSPDSFVLALGSVFLTASVVASALLFLYTMCRPQGVGATHFRWRSEALQLARRHLAWFIPLVLVVGFLHLIVLSHTIESRNSFGRLAFLIIGVAKAVIIQRLIRPGGPLMRPFLQKKPQGWLNRLRYIWYPAAVGVPLVLAGAAIFGYYYTARELSLRLDASVLLVLAVVIGHAFVLRWLSVTERRLAYEQAVEKRKAERAKLEEAVSDEAPPAELEPDEIDISKMDEQTRRLTQTLASLAVLIGLWLVWSGVLPALSILENVRLWSTTIVDSAGASIPGWITLQDLALSLIILILTFVAAKNLPGVLELAVLKNLPIDAGVRYAISAVSQYLLVVVGIVLTFNAIGVGWTKVQWLVAALSVGVGFGLQEIIANFFCGIILLFERPIRVGDIVTVNDVMGIVSRIRIRATTITNWDRMEFVIPNKDLITGRLLNWTLSNTVNRIVINVGVAYGSDIKKARELLLKVAEDHPLIMEDPAPLATFEGFGDSTLNFVLRCYLPDFTNRLATIDELHSTIDAEFAKAGITIAFPQMDVHLQMSPAVVSEAEEKLPEGTVVK